MNRPIINTPGRRLLDRLTETTPRQPINPERLAETILGQLPGKGKTMNLFNVIVAIVLMLAAVIIGVEGQGTGEEKKALALSLFKEGVQSLPLPSFLTKLLAQDAFVGPIIDMLVKLANLTGLFTKTPAPSPG